MPKRQHVNRTSTWISRRCTLKRMIKEGWTLQKIGKRYGVCKQRVSQALRDLGLKTKNSKRETPT